MKVADGAEEGASNRCEGGWWWGRGWGEAEYFLSVLSASTLRHRRRRLTTAHGPSDAEGLRRHPDPVVSRTSTSPTTTTKRKQAMVDALLPTLLFIDIAYHDSDHDHARHDDHQGHQDNIHHRHHHHQEGRHHQHPRRRWLHHETTDDLREFVSQECGHLLLSRRPARQAERHREAGEDGDDELRHHAHRTDGTRQTRYNLRRSARTGIDSHSAVQKRDQQQQSAERKEKARYPATRDGYEDDEHEEGEDTETNLGSTQDDEERIESGGAVEKDATDHRDDGEYGRSQLIDLVHQRLDEAEVQQVIRFLDRMLAIAIRKSKQDGHDSESASDDDAYAWDSPDSGDDEESAQLHPSKNVVIAKLVAKTVPSLSQQLEKQCKALNAVEATLRIVTVRRLIQRCLVAAGRALVLPKDILLVMCRDMNLHHGDGAKREVVRILLRYWSMRRYIHWNSESDPDQECAVCTARRVSVVLLPCRHAVCAACQVAMAASRRRTCAFCRRRVRLVWPGLEVEHCCVTPL